jgi:hypothetical protein
MWTPENRLRYNRDKLRYPSDPRLRGAGSDGRRMAAYRAAWYKKRDPTFSDAIATVRRVLWTPPDLSMSRQATDTIKMPVRLVKRFVETLCLAA